MSFPLRQIYIGQSESDLATFISETYAIKTPLELALEEVEKPVPTPEEASSKSTLKGATFDDFKKDPVSFVKTRGIDFLEKASVDPKKAFTEEPLVGGVVGIVFATLIGMLGVCKLRICLPFCPFKITGLTGPSGAVTVISLLLPSSSSPAVQKSVKTVKAKASTAATTVSDVASDATEKVKEQVAPIAEAGKQKVEELQEGVRTRAKSAKTKTDE